MVFSWAPSVFTKKLVTSPIRIWPYTKRRKRDTNIFVKQRAETAWIRADQLQWIFCQLNMAHSKIIHVFLPQPGSDCNFPHHSLDFMLLYEIPLTPIHIPINSNSLLSVGLFFTWMSQRPLIFPLLFLFLQELNCSSIKPQQYFARSCEAS